MRSRLILLTIFYTPFAHAIETLAPVRVSAPAPHRAQPQPERPPAKPRLTPLETLPSLWISSLGGPGQLSTARMRGARASQTEVRFGDISLNTPAAFGGVDLAFLPRSHTAAQTNTHTSAIGGTLALEPLPLSLGTPATKIAAEIEGASLPQGRASASITRAQNRFAARLSGHGMRAGPKTRLNPLHGNRLIDETTQGVTMLQMKAMPKANTTLELLTLHSLSNTRLNRTNAQGLPETSPDRAQPHTFLGALKAMATQGPWTHKGTLSHVQQGGRYSFMNQNTTTLGQNQGARYQLTRAWDRHHTFSSDIEVLHKSLRTQDLNAHTTAVTATLAHDLTHPLLDLNTSFSLHHPTHVTAQMHARIPLQGSFAALAGIATGHRSPELSDQAARAPWQVANPGLKPEESFTFEGGLAYAKNLEIVYFHKHIKHLIAPVPVGPSLFQAQNKDARTIQGVEARLSCPLSQTLDLSATYTYTDAQDHETGRTTRALRTPSHRGTVGTRGQFKKVTYACNLELHGTQQDLDFSAYPERRVTLPRKLALTLEAEGPLPFIKNTTLFGRAENALNTISEDIYGYGNQPFTAYLGLRITT